MNIPLYVYNLIIFCMIFLFCRFMNGVVFLSHDHVFLQAICSSLHVCTFSHYLLLFSPRFMMYFSNIQLHVSYCGIYNRLISSSGMEINPFFFFFFNPRAFIPSSTCWNAVTLPLCQSSRLYRRHASCDMIVVAMVTPVTFLTCLCSPQTRMSPGVTPLWTDATRPRAEGRLRTERYNIQPFINIPNTNMHFIL